MNNSWACMEAGAAWNVGFSLVPRFIRPTEKDVIRHRRKVPSDLRRRWFSRHIVGQYGRRYDGNLTIGNAVFTVTQYAGATHYLRGTSDSHSCLVSSDLRRRWFSCHIVGQYGRRNDGNLTIENAVFTVTQCIGATH